MEEGRKQTRMELLAPAGDWLAFKAGVENGADAIYLGGKSFNARAGAENFSLDELRQSVRYAHERDVKVYVTVNTLVTDDELSELAEYLYHLHEIRVDGLIIQDIGVAALARAILPEVPLHASTQMTVNNIWGVQRLAKMGFSRVVLARECSAAQISGIARHSPLEVEVFVHGALCVCYSGQCLMSSFIGGRSGNRGKCAQPCRMAYHLLDQQQHDVLAQQKIGEHLLSTRDMNLSEQLGRLQTCGVRSLKVEGRMKRPEYVATVIRLYRQALNHLTDLDADADHLLTPEEQRQLAQIFNRDFSTAYLNENPGAALMSYHRPNNRGLRLGRVLRGEQGQMVVKLENELRVGDGIEVWNNRGREGVNVERIFLTEEEQGQRSLHSAEQADPGQTVQLLFNGWVNPGDRVFKTHDALLIREAQSSYQEGHERRKRPLRLRLSGQIGEQLCLEASSGTQCERVFSSSAAQAAVNRPLTRETALRQLSRLGTTPFLLQECETELSGDLMIPISELNDMRRRVVEALLRPKHHLAPVAQAVFQQRCSDWRAVVWQTRQRTARGVLPALSVAVSSLANLKAGVQAGARRIVFGGEHWRSREGLDFADVQRALAYCQNYGAQGIWRWPHILSQEESALWNKRLTQVAQWAERPAIMVANLGALEMVRTVDPDWPLELDYPLNIFNALSVAYCLEQGVRNITLSPELSRAQIAQLASWPATEILVFGDMKMMVSEYCLLGSTLGGKQGEQCSQPCRRQPYTLQDRLRLNFPLETDHSCRMHLFNSKTLNLYPVLDDVAGLGVKRIRLELVRATERQIRWIIPLFDERWTALMNHPQAKPTEQKIDWESYYPEGFTKGHYYRGVV
ncbi:MAG: DUF3656 domain-containing protein [Peptococcaceae bacterium]|jgi:putative protease|nr:DUF3656 domain-containing protein [Peptococcaceae bacterium]